jgi:AcrR family transcriptional regulator
MQTRERIIETSLQLFNDEGTASISTNHIAAALAISPGNLYYHFRNKEAIVRAIFTRLADDWSTACQLPEHQTPNITDFLHILEGNVTIVWTYRFFYREMPVLVRRDPELATLYQALRNTGVGTIERLFEAFIAAGVMQAPDTPETVSRLAQACLILGDSWFPFEELDGQPLEPGDLERGVALIMDVFRPYFSDSAVAKLEAASTSS